MQILVTGATGFIGRSVVQLLVERGDDVRALVRPSSDRSVLKGLNVEICSGDVIDRGSIARAARGVEAVIHSAAWVSLYSRNLHEMRQVNVTGVENVASVALEVGARRLVNVSSIVAVGAAEDASPVTEDFPWPFATAPVPYLITKREGELAAFRYARHGMEVVTVNPCMVVGAPDPRGADPGGILKFLRRKLPVAIDGGSNYVDVWDVAESIIAALDRGRSGERYILGGENLSLQDYYALLEELSGIPAPRRRVPHAIMYQLSVGMDRLERWTGREMPLNRQILWMAGWRWFADSTKARRELGMPYTPLRESLARAIDYYRSRRMV
jgi:dihydroflavonol-4-reductase